MGLAVQSHSEPEIGGLRDGVPTRRSCAGCRPRRLSWRGASAVWINLSRSGYTSTTVARYRAVCDSCAGSHGDIDIEIL